MNAPTPATPTPEELERLRFPIGRFKPRSELSDEERLRSIEEIATLPPRLRAALAGVPSEVLDTPYRAGGWTVRQVVHHLPDSHLNAYLRFKVAVTEDAPEVKTYSEAAWAELADARDEDIEVSLQLLDALHRRWVTFLRSLTPEQFDRTYRHPEHGQIPLRSVLQLYAWHGRHHLAHITAVVGGAR